MFALQTVHTIVLDTNTGDNLKKIQIDRTDMFGCCLKLGPQFGMSDIIKGQLSCSYDPVYLVREAITYKR